ncbi:ABC transporter substrate-binding protein [Neorhodopirellula lusitana]|uniref:ABC transporter substrate-binding protein n=1 Tax=Neorhodopirellula lusitana TaxID=445327 RepID=UPI00384C54A5
MQEGHPASSSGRRNHRRAGYLFGGYPVADCAGLVTRVQPVALSVLVWLVCILVGCQPSVPAKPPAADSSATITDRLGRVINADIKASRIVSLSPETTELLFALDLGPMIVGATQYCDYPAAALEIPRVGGGIMESLSTESIIAARPDLVLCKWDAHAPLVESLDRLNVRSMAVGAQSLAELFEEAVWLGKVTGHEEQAERFIAGMKSRRDQLVEVVQKAQRERSTLPKLNQETSLNQEAHFDQETQFDQEPGLNQKSEPDRKPGTKLKVFYEVWGDPLMSAGPDSFIGEILRLAGLENILPDSSTRYPRISAETVLRANPDLILAPTVDFSDLDVESIRSRPGWDQIAAVRNHRIHLLSGDEVSRCGPRLMDALAEIILAAYPQVSPQDVAR